MTITTLPRTMGRHERMTYTGRGVGSAFSVAAPGTTTQCIADRRSAAGTPVITAGRIWAFGSPERSEILEFLLTLGNLGGRGRAIRGAGACCLMAGNAKIVASDAWVSTRHKDA